MVYGGGGGGGGGVMPPIVVTPREIVNVVGIFVTKHRKKWYGNREKCYESNVMLKFAVLM
jgi:hypothetical protein